MFRSGMATLLVLLGLLSVDAFARIPCPQILAPPRGAQDDLLLNLLGILLSPQVNPRRAEVTAADLGHSRMAIGMLRLAEQGLLLDQLSNQLVVRGLIVPNGGLCAPTCAVNTLGPHYAERLGAAAFQKMAPDMLEALIRIYASNFQEQKTTNLSLALKQQNPEAYLQIFNQENPLGAGSVDGRQGGFPRILLSNLRTVLEQFGVTVHTNQPPTWRTLAEGSLSDSLFLITANLHDSQSGSMASVHGVHALVVLKLLDSNELVISDPNRANEIYRSKIWFTGNKVTFQTRLQYTAAPTIATIENIEMLKRAPY